MPPPGLVAAGGLGMKGGGYSIETDFNLDIGYDVDIMYMIDIGYHAWGDREGGVRGIWLGMRGRMKIITRGCISESLHHHSDASRETTTLMHPSLKPTATASHKPTDHASILRPEFLIGSTNQQAENLNRNDKI